MRKIYLTLLALLISGSWVSAQISTFPQFEDFESETQGPTGCGPAYSTISTLWDNGDDANPADATHQLDWTSDLGGTGSTNTGPTANGGADHTIGTNAGHYMYTESSCSGTGYPSITANMISTLFDFSGTTAPRMNFWYHMYGTSMGMMHVDVDSTGNGDWDLDVVTPWTDNQDLWQEMDLALPVYADRDSVRIRIRMVTGTSFGSDAAIDDILIYEPQPYDLQADAVTSPVSGCGLGLEDVILDFTNVGTDSLMAGDTIWMSYQVDANPVVTEAYVLSGSLPASASDTYTFATQADLSTFAAYNITVYLSYPQDSAWGNDTLMITVNNIPVNVVTDFFEDDFESGFGWTGTGDWALGTAAKPNAITGAASGVNAWVAGGLATSYAANTNDYVESPCFDLSAMCDPWVSADVWWNSEFSWDGANLWYSTDGGGTWTLVGASGDPYNWYNDNTINGNPGPNPGNGQGWTGRNSSSNGSGTWVESHHSLPGLAGNSGVIFRMYFGSDGSVQDDGFAFDNFRLYDGVWLGKDMFLCKGDTTTLDARGSAGASYLWSTGDTTQTLQVTMSGWYSVDVTSDTNCTNNDSIYVFIQDSTSQIFNDDSLSLCGITADVCPNYLPLSTVYMSTGDTVMMDAFSPGLACVNVDTTQMITAFAVTPCDTIWDTLYVEILGEPTVDLGNDSTQCGGSIDLDAGTQTTYMWSTGDTAQMITVTMSGTYGVTVTDANGCDANDDVMVTINTIPTVDLGADVAACMGDTVCLMPTAVDSSASYSWSTGETTSTICVTAAGDYIVTIADSNGCSSSDTVSVTMGAAPTSGFTSAMGAGGLDWTFTDGSTDATTYAWDFGDGGTSTSASPTHTYAASGTYTVCLTVTNSCGTDSTCETLTVVGIDELTGVSVLIYPNPNNGTFSVEFDGINSTDVELSVVNLYGQTVYTENIMTVAGKVRKDLQLNVSQGVYFIRLATDRGHLVRRITVE